MKNTTIMLMLMAIIALSSCEKVDYNTLNGRWYGYANSWYIDFDSHSFSGKVKGCEFNGHYTIKRKRLSLKFNNEAPSGFEVFYDDISRVNSYDLGSKQLSLHGVNFEILLIR